MTEHFLDVNDIPRILSTVYLKSCSAGQSLLMLSQRAAAATNCMAVRNSLVRPYKSQTLQDLELHFHVSFERFAWHLKHRQPVGRIAFRNFQVRVIQKLPNQLLSKTRTN